MASDAFNLCARRKTSTVWLPAISQIRAQASLSYTRDRFSVSLKGGSSLKTCSSITAMGVVLAVAISTLLPRKAEAHAY